MRTQLALHIRFTEYTGIYNVRTGFVDKQDGELTAKMCGSPQSKLKRLGLDIFFNFLTLKTFLSNKPLKIARTFSSLVILMRVKE